MQAAGMLRGTGAVYARGVSVLLLGTLILAFIGDNAHALPLQILPNIPGYIPVYIRSGDQPLDEINPALAEAFHEKQTLENIPSERSDQNSDNIEANAANSPSYDENDGLNAGKRRKGTIFLIGVRQSADDETKKDDDIIVPKIALPFEVLEREAVEANAADNQDHDGAEDAWIGESAVGSHERKPIGLSRETIIKTSGLPVDVKDLEKLAADVEKEETRPNDLYDSSIGNNDHHRSSSSRRTIPKKLFSENSREMKEIKLIKEDVVDDRLIRPIENPKEHRSARLIQGEAILRPARDPKESRPDDEAMDFMQQEE